jgi:hypothetical protein
MNNKYIKTDVDGLVKDPVSGAILNIDNTKLAAYKKQKRAFEIAQNTTQRLDKLEGDMSEIKQMLQLLLKR